MRTLIIFFSLLLASHNLCAQQKIVERSSKKAPEWIGVSVVDHIIVSAEAETLNIAKEKCLSNIRQSIVNSVATNISSRELTLDTQTIDGQTTDVLHRYESQIEAVAAKLPFVTGISLDDAEIYWQKLYNKHEKSYKYEVHAKYPFPLIRRNSLIMEYMKQDRAQNEKYQMLKSQFSTFTEIEFINRAINELKTLQEYFVDQRRKDEAKTLASNYRRLYGSISIVPYHNALGEIVYYLNLGGRRMTTSRQPNIKSQYATNISFAPTSDAMYRITYDYEHCLDTDENKIEVIHNFTSGSARYNFYFDVSKDKLQIVPYGQIEMDIELAEVTAEAPTDEQAPADAQVNKEEQEGQQEQQEGQQEQQKGQQEQQEGQQEQQEGQQEQQEGQQDMQEELQVAEPTNVKESIEAQTEAVIPGEKPAKIQGWIDLRSKYDTPFEVVHINFAAGGTRIRVNSDLSATFEGKGNHRLTFNVEGKYLPTEQRMSMARGVITIVNKATKSQEEINFYLPYKIVIK